MNDAPVVISVLQQTGFDEAEVDLAELLLDGIRGGASIGFLNSTTEHEARDWWRDSLRAPNKITLIARRPPSTTIVGVVQLVLATYPNSLHRAEVSKLLVHRSERGRGVSSRLMSALEGEAIRTGRWLLILDTHSGSPAEQIYTKWGWNHVGVVDSFAGTPDGQLIATTFMSKTLSIPSDGPGPA